MTDKKFTDEEIIKANDILDKLDFFNQRAGRELWNEKPVEIQDADIRNREEDIKFLKALINRQNSEIERLQSANDDKFHQWDMLAEKTKQHYANLYEEAKDILKAEAYKECLAKVKNYIKTHCNPYGKPDFDYDTSIRILNFIGNLIKEMTGESDD